MRSFMILAGVATLAAIPAFALAAGADPLAELDTLFKGRAPEAPVDCVQLRGSYGLRIIGTTTIIIRHRNGLIYRSDPPGGCPAQRGSYQLATNPSDVRLCEGNPVGVVDVERGVQIGACNVGQWTPYRRISDKAPNP